MLVKLIPSCWAASRVEQRSIYGYDLYHILDWEVKQNAVSKKLSMLKAAVALFVVWYDFCRPHMSLSECTPAMECGITDHVWTLSELLSGV